MMQIKVSGSSSDGNCTAIIDKETNKVLIVDCGISPPPRIKFENIIGVFVTHCHKDHTACLREVINQEIYGTVEELRNMNVTKILNDDYSNVKYITCLSTYELGPFKVTPYPAVHDSPNPVHFKIETKDDSIWYGCDSRDYDDETVFSAATSCNKIMVECNYDEDMMFNDTPLIKSYSSKLKGRIVNEAHASNQYIAERFKDYRDKLILCHISKNYNSFDRIKSVFGKKCRVIDTNLCPNNLKNVCKKL